MAVGGAATAVEACVPIAAARLAARGTRVTVEGLVTVPSGDFHSSSGDEGFAIEDQTGGIWVSLKQNLRLGLGQHLQVTGRMGESNDKVQVVTRPGFVQLLPGQELRVATGQVGPVTLGFVVTVQGTVTSVEPDPPDGSKVFVDDGSGPAQVYLNASTDINPDAPWFQPGSTIRVTGFGNVYLTAYEVDPRSLEDVKPL